MPQINKLTSSDLSVCHHHNDEYTSHFTCARENVENLKNWFLKNCNPCLNRSLKIYCQLDNARTMSTQDLCFFPKEFILKFMSSDIEDIWDKLPKEYRNDKEIADCRRCRKHNPSLLDKSSTDGNDDEVKSLNELPNFLLPMKKYCYMCKLLKKLEK